MEQQERDALAVKITECAFFYGKMDLDKHAITSFLNILSKFYSKYTFVDFNNAFDSYMNDIKNRFFPNPAQLREYLEKKIDIKLEATALARKIDKLVLSKESSWCDGFYCNPEYNYYYGKDKVKYWTFKEALVSEVGEIGYKVVESRGGWRNLCASAFDNQESTFIAQLRDQCEYEIKHSLFQDNEIKNVMIENINLKHLID